MEYTIESKSREDLRRLAYNFRKLLGLHEQIYFPIVEVLDIMCEICDSFSYEIVSEDELPPDTHADTNVVTGHIRIKESIYNRACNGEGRDRMTIAHEIGHFMTVCLCGFKLERNLGESTTAPRYKDPEWQAKCFAGELLVPLHLVKSMDPAEISKKCGVSLSAAEIQYKHI